MNLHCCPSASRHPVALRFVCERGGYMFGCFLVFNGIHHTRTCHRTEQPWELL